MSNEVAIPDYLKAMMAEGTVQDTTSDMMVATGGVPRLTTKGKVFRFKKGEDEEKAGQEVDLVIVGVNPERGLSHTFYSEGYSSDASSPPDCSSMNGLTPDSWISNPIHDNCLKCPNQVWGSAESMSGGKAKACKDSKQLYVAKAEDFSKNPETCTLWLIAVTVNSLKSFTNYGKELSLNKIPGPQFAITRISFDEDASVPKLNFKLLGLLDEKHGPVSHARNQSKEWDVGSSKPAIAGNNSKALPNQPEEAVQTTGKSPESVSDLVDNW